MASKFAFGVLPIEGSSSTTIRATIQLYSLSSLTQTTGLGRFKLSPKGASVAQLWNESTLRDAVITNSIDIPQQEPSAR